MYPSKSVENNTLWWSLISFVGTEKYIEKFPILLLLYTQPTSNQAFCSFEIAVWGEMFTTASIALSDI